MIDLLQIRNLVLVPGLDMSFEPGLNVVTGETGAGKSLVLGAVQLLLGERASPTVIRTGADQCEITAVIALRGASADVTPRVTQLLEDSGLPPCEDGKLVLRRVVTRSGSRAFVNARPVTVQILRALGDLLVDIHGPHDHQSLLQNRNQLDVLDAFAGLSADATQCSESWHELRRLRDELDVARGEYVSQDDLRLLRHELTEIESAELSEENETQTIERHRVVANSRRLLDIALQCNHGLTEAEGSILEQLTVFVHLIQEIAETDSERGSEFATRIGDAIVMLQDLSFELQTYADTLELDEEELAALEERLDLIQRLKRKYGPGIDGVLATANELQARISEVECREKRVRGLGREVEDAQAQYEHECGKLRERRLETAARLGEAITGKLQKLGFARSELSVRVEESTPGPMGADRVEFCFAPNPGEPLLPLRRIASSGEMARVMLAVKTVLTAADRVPILLFDEVDVNVGGRIAVKVAEELQAIAEQHQVFAITHLPQVAAAGDQHFVVTKTVVDGRTLTNMQPVTGNERRQELVRMLGAPEASKTAEKHAQEMLDSAR